VSGWTLREARRRVYELISSDVTVQALATGGVIPINRLYSFQDRTSLGPHIFYYPQSHVKDGFKRWRVRLVAEVVVPFGDEYAIDGEPVDAYEYSERLMSAVINAVERVRPGEPVIAAELGGGLVVGDGVYIWQVYLETVVTEV